MNRQKIVSATVLSSVLLFNTGCLIKYNNEGDAPETVYQNGTVVAPSSKRSYPPPYDNPEVECSDDKVTTTDANNCDRGTISSSELQRPHVSGEVHKLTSIRGKTIHIGERKTGFVFPQYRNKVIILEMFGKNCPHCIKEISVFNKIRKRYRGKLEVIAIQSQGRMSRAAARNYINKYRIRYPIIEGDTATNLQFFIQSTYGWTGILPYTLVIKNGVTEFSYTGEVSYNEIKNDIDSLF